MVTLSIISNADGTMPAPIMSETACDASSRDLKAANSVTTDSGTFHQSHGYLGDDSQCSLRADERASEVISEGIARLTAEPGARAIC